MNLVYNVFRFNIAFLVMLLFFAASFINSAEAITNTQSIDLEHSSSQLLYVADANQTGLGITGDVSIEAWVKLEQLPSDLGQPMFVVGKADTSYRSYELFLTWNDKLAFQFTDGSGWTAAEGASVTFTADDVGEWVHIAATADVSQGYSGVSLYKDGVAIVTNSQGNAATTIQDTTAQFAVGKGSVYHAYFDGLIDEVRVWSDVRTASEVADNRLTSLTGSESNLEGYWDLNNDLTDATSNGNDLTNSGSALFSEEPANALMCSIDGLF